MTRDEKIAAFLRGVQASSEIAFGAVDAGWLPPEAVEEAVREERERIRMAAHDWARKHVYDLSSNTFMALLELIDPPKPEPPTLYVFDLISGDYNPATPDKILAAAAALEDAR